MGNVKLKIAMVENHITQSELSKRSGLSIGAVHKAVKGNNVSLFTAQKISKVFKKSVDDLFDAQTN